MAFVRPLYSAYTAILRPLYGHYTVIIRSLYGHYTTIIRPSCYTIVWKIYDKIVRLQEICQNIVQQYCPILFNNLNCTA